MLSYTKYTNTISLDVTDVSGDSRASPAARLGLLEGSNLRSQRVITGLCLLDLRIILIEKLECGTMKRRNDAMAHSMAKFLDFLGKLRVFIVGR